MNKYDAYEITPMVLVENDVIYGKIVEPADPGDEIYFWSLFGHVPGEGVECIADFPTRDAAVISLMTSALANAHYCLNERGRTSYKDVDWVLLREALRFAHEQPSHR